MRGVGLVLCVVSLGFGCSKSSKPAGTGSGSGSGSATARPGPLDPNAPNVAAPIATDEPSCEERAIALQDKLRARPAVERPRYEVPRVKRWRDLDSSGPTIVVREDTEIVIEGNTVPEDRLPRFMEALLEQERGPIDVQAEPGVDVAKLALLVEAAGKRELRLIVGRDGEVADVYANVKAPKGAGDWFAPLIDQLRTEKDPAKKQKLLRDGMEKAMGTQCKELPEAFKKVGQANPADVQEVLATSVARALDACQCAGVDPGFYELMAMLNADVPSHGYLPLAKPFDKAKTAGDLAKVLADRESAGASK